MAFKTIKSALADTLENLTKDDFDRFCHKLLDRRERPRVGRNKVENKTRLQIVDALVSTFTEAKCVQVVQEILTQIGCNEEAKELESKTKHFGDNGDPTFRKTPDGQLDMKPSQEALNYAACQWPLTAARQGDPAVKKKPEEVKAEATARVLSEGGDPRNDRLILSRCTIQMGKYKGQTFKWLLENDISYTALLVASHQAEREHTMRQDPLMANKDSLTQYSIAYPEVKNEIRFHKDYERAKERSRQPGQEGKALVGFGKHRSKTLKQLYDSNNTDMISYVNFLRNKQSTCEPGSRMEDAINYILQRDQEKTKRKRQARRKRAQSPRSQATSASRPLRRKLN